VVKSIPTRRLVGTLLVLAALAGSFFLLPRIRAAPDPPVNKPILPALPSAGAGTSAMPADLPPALPDPAGLLRLSRDVPGDCKPLLLNADEFATWIEKGQRLILMKGQVLIQQGVVRVRSKEAVVFVNLDRVQRTGILHADIFAEGEVHLEDGRSDRKGNKALLDLSTRGELKIHSQVKRVLQQPVPDAPLFQRAVAEVFGAPAPPTGNIVPVGARETVGPRSGAALATPRPIAPPPPPSGYTPMLPPQPVQVGPPQTVPPAPIPVVPPGPAYPPSPEGPPAPVYQPAPMGLPPAVPPPAVSPPGAPLPDAPLPAVPPPAVPPPAVPPGSVSAVFRLSGAELPAVPTSGTTATPTQRTPAPTPSGPGAAAGSRLGMPVPGADGSTREYSVVPRSMSTFQLKSEVLPNGEQASIFTGGINIAVRSANGTVLFDIEADNALIWSRGGLTPPTDRANSSQPQGNRDPEFYFSGNVAIRSTSISGSRTLRAAEVYLDPKRNVAIAMEADLEIKQNASPKMPTPQPIHLRAEELRQLSPTRFEGLKTDVFSSKLPSDPGLLIHFTQATLEEVRVPKKTFFGSPIVDRYGKPDFDIQRPVEGTGATVRLESFPIFYLPWFKTDASRPLGPVDSISVGENRIFGFEFGVTLDAYNLFQVQPIPDSRWKLHFDEMSSRGPALGSDFDLASKTFFEMPAKATTMIRSYGMYDTGTDNLGGNRGEDDNHPDYRGRLRILENVQELPLGFSLQGQLSYLSDHNFLEQYYKQEFDNDINQATFIYAKQQQNNWAWTALVEPRIREWVTETQWLPRADGYLIGQSFFDLFTYSAHASAGFADLRLSNNPFPPVSVTDRNDSTGRFDLIQEISLPFYLGPVKVVPYGILDLTDYTTDLDGTNGGRVWAAAGLRTSMPLTRLYPDVHSLLFNVDGLMHKIVLSSNYLLAGSSDPYTKFPQLDRLNDDATNQALQDINPLQPLINPAHGLFLATSPIFDPQLYAIRSLVENRIDTLDNIQEVELDIRQRLQTKRGFPGNEHIVDWMTLDLSVSLFPAAKRDDFGSTVAFAQWDYLWNIGDRTSITSSGWVDPINNGPRFYALGVFLDRPDRTSFYIGYRQIDPVESKAVTAAATYVFSPKYAMTASSTYDFGTSQALANSLVFTRMGTDLNVSLGFTYNALQNNFGFVFEIMPSLLAGRTRSALTSVGGPGGVLR
jgi:hypothetical protein